MNPSSIKNVIKPAIYVPETKLIYELYHEFLNNGIMMVFVVNEHGAVTGLATREDIAEEIFGEIQTREHESKDFVAEITKGKYLVDASLDIDIFEKIFSLKIDKRNYDTVAGFIMWLSGKIPKTGEKYIYEGCEITISESDSRSIKSVTVRKRTS
jgi:CBS domain containing-hemolysin-like protein